jgi:hypothetical protein
MILARVEPGVTSQLPFTACKLLSLSLSCLVNRQANCDSRKMIDLLRRSLIDRLWMPNANTAENLIILCEMFRDDNKRHVNRLDDESLFISGLST